MTIRRALRPAVGLAFGLALVLPAAVPAAAQDAATTVVTAHDYYYEGLPTSVPAGTTISLVNSGAEVHMIIIARKNDDTTESWDELIAMPEDQANAKVTTFGPLFAAPGQTAEGTLVLDKEGEYIALCFIPQGTTAIPSMDPNASTDPNASPPAGVGSGPPHFLLGMRQEFTVTAAGTSPGPLPQTPPSMAPMPAASPSAAG